MEVILAKREVDLKLKHIKDNLKKIALDGVTEGIRSCLEKHFFARQKEPRKDGFPKQGFWYSNNGFLEDYDF